MIETDEALGLILDQMDAKNMWDSTVVVFWSDHGLNMGEHNGQWLKLTLFEESLRVPFIICAPGRPAGICEKPVELIDIFPTLIDLCGLPANPDLHGVSLAPLLERPNINFKKGIFAQMSKNYNNSKVMAKAARTEQYHYNSWQSYGEELYDVIADPKEYINLAGNPAYQNVLTEMRNLLAAGWKGALPPVYTKKMYYRDYDGDGYGSKTDSIARYFPPTGYVTISGDCNDNNKKINPGAIEDKCNNIDDNCNNKIDENRPKPTITPTGTPDLCPAGYVILKTNSDPKFVYQWKLNGVDIPGATQKSYRATEAGVYTVYIKHTANNCDNTSDGKTVIRSCKSAVIGGESSAVTKIEVSPNPSKGIIKVSYTSLRSEKVQLRVYDKLGKTLFVQIENAIEGENVYSLKLSHLHADLYNLEISNTVEKSNTKFVIDK